jgi:hypothetical protein
MELCRLCMGPTKTLFTKRVLGWREVSYMKCLSCGSLQTERPTWLAEAYAIPGVHIDVGQASRVLHTWLHLCRLLEVIGFFKSQIGVDYGASTGLLTRWMRDLGYDFYAYDPYETCKYANYFRVESLRDVPLQLLTAFEVFEHLPDPRESINEMLESGAALVVFTTNIYEDQPADWHYLVPNCGQHVFFYTAKALTEFGNARGFDFVQTNHFHVFVRQTTPYAITIKSHRSLDIDPEFIARQVMAIGWWAEAVARDQEHAVNRFDSELPGTTKTSGAAAGRRSRRWLKRLVSYVPGQG